jgi:PadR family transcriptional regulator PadR
MQARAGADISRRVTVGYGTLYPMLNRLEKGGWVTSEWEVIDPSEAGRPRRRFYKLSALGQAKAREAFVDLQVAPEVLVWTS